MIIVMLLQHCHKKWQWSSTVIIEHEQEVEMLNENMNVFYKVFTSAYYY